MNAPGLNYVDVGIELRKNGWTFDRESGLWSCPSRSDLTFTAAVLFCIRTSGKEFK